MRCETLIIYKFIYIYTHTTFINPILTPTGVDCAYFRSDVANNYWGFSDKSLIIFPYVYFNDIFIKILKNLQFLSKFT